MDFDARIGTYTFKPWSPLWGYLPQINEWGRGQVQWHVARVGGPDHVPQFQAVPIWYGQPLVQYTCWGYTKKAAKESAARAMALSGHC
ncbi:hypothetical protein EUX98_g1036 [Antrodiella citrinella]|uniref:DRBM domain-containing protein n=1 Tax=Antrodiella citrinella TaxID=2447956 RepID=A0A4S4NB26_9APHY|nr:hypothetical protein EUX98_g1036 [Antrodiella citrinella]